MYSIKDKSMAIREVQKYLLIISQIDKDIVDVVVDGIYGSATRAAVSIFQGKNGLPITGAVDLATFNLLFSRYLAILAERDARDSALEKEEYPLKIGDSSNDIGILNSYLRALSESYIDQPSPDCGNYYSLTTQNAVKYLQRRFGEEENGKIDLKTLKRIIAELDARKLINKINRPV